jgi:hypothetical protein
VSTATASAAGELLREVVIGRRFNGPPDSANGGYACGVLARFLPDPAEITLRKPPPLARPLAVREDGEGKVSLLDGDELVAEGRAAGPVEVEPPVRPAFDDAVTACAHHPWRGQRHQLSDCFVCSPGRRDGLGISPGPLEGAAGVTSAPFVPDATVAEDGLVRPEVVWAALDCPSYPPEFWARGPVALLGRMSAAREREIRVGERLVAVGWSLGADGRKHTSASALLDADGAVVARARATWIELRG